MYSINPESAKNLHLGKILKLFRLSYWVFKDKRANSVDPTEAFLPHLDEVQEELLYYPCRRRWQRRRYQNVKVFTLKFFMWWARRCQGNYPVPV